jgi:hypothetical protein
MISGAVDWLRYGALGVAGLALAMGAWLLRSPPRVSGAAAEQWHANLKRFMTFAIVLAVVAASIELLEHVLPNRSEQAKLAQLQTDLTTAQDNLTRTQNENNALRQIAEKAETLLGAATDKNLFATEITGYANSLNQLSASKRCLDSSLIPDETARNLIIGMLDGMDAVIRQIAAATGQKLSEAPPCRQKS